MHQKVVLNGSGIIITSDNVWIVQNGMYLTYSKTDRKRNFSLILLIFDFKCKIINKMLFNGSDI